MKDWKQFWQDHVAMVDPKDRFRQVLRVQNKETQSQDSFRLMMDHITSQLQLNPEGRVLDLCCGNGLISHELIGLAGTVVAVDFCEALIDAFALSNCPNLHRLVGDANSVAFESESFDRILCAAALQHFSQAQVVRLFHRAQDWLAEGGLFLITDILDSDRQWSFFNTMERERDYFESLRKDQEILGTWFNKVWLTKLALYAGFRTADPIDQPDTLLYSHYRFDFRCRK